MASLLVSLELWTTGFVALVAVLSTLWYIYHFAFNLQASKQFSYTWLLLCSFLTCRWVPDNINMIQDGVTLDDTKQASVFRAFLWKRVSLFCSFIGSIGLKKSLQKLLNDLSVIKGGSISFLWSSWKVIKQMKFHLVSAFQYYSYVNQWTSYVLQFFCDCIIDSDKLLDKLSSRNAGMPLTTSGTKAAAHLYQTASPFSGRKPILLRRWLCLEVSSRFLLVSIPHRMTRSTTTCKAFHMKQYRGAFRISHVWFVHGYRVVRD